MRQKLLRLGALLAALLLCTAVGLLVGRLSNSPLSGLLCSAALGLGAMMLSDTLKGNRLLAWLRTDAEGPAPGDIGVWGEIAHLTEKVLLRREQRIEQEQQRLKRFLAAVEASPIGVMLLDANHQISWCSRVAADHLGLDPKRDIAQPVTNLVRMPAFVEHMSAGPSEQAVSFPGPNGNRLSALVQPYGDGLQLVLTQDITERERAETMRRNFVANVSHEIRTPLTVLAGFVETMSELPLTEAERKRVLALMSAQARRMQDLVADLLTLAQLEGSPRPPADQWVMVAKLLERAKSDALALSAGRHDLHFDGGEDVQLAGSQTELQSALSNLVMNAVHYTPPGGRIDVHLVRCRRWLGFSSRQRHRHRHRARTPAAADRALLSRGRQPFARHRRHGSGPVDRQARGAAAWRRDRHPERAGQGLHLQAAFPAITGASRGACVAAGRWGRDIVLIAAAQRAGSRLYTVVRLLRSVGRRSRAMRVQPCGAGRVAFAGSTRTM